MVAQVQFESNMVPRVGHATEMLSNVPVVSSAANSGHPGITQDESECYELDDGRLFRSTNRAHARGPEIWFRIVHSAVPSEKCALPAAYREQEVEVAFGPIGVLQDCDVGTLTRRIAGDHVVRVVTPARSILKPAGPKTSRVPELLRMAIEWKRQIDAGELQNKAEVARRAGITRARVTQVMGLLDLTPEVQERILSLPVTHHRSPVTERALRPVRTLTNSRDQLREFQELLI